MIITEAPAVKLENGGFRTGSRRIVAAVVNVLRIDPGEAAPPRLMGVPFAAMLLLWRLPFYYRVKDNLILETQWLTNWTS